MRTKIAVILLSVLLLSPIFALGSETRYSYRPEAGYVPDAETAIAIAVAVWTSIYGRKQIESEKPYKAVLIGGTWHVSGSLPAGYDVGGVAEAEIAKEDGRILRVIHGK
jgi:hypothetical protein